MMSRLKSQRSSRSLRTMSSTKSTNERKTDLKKSRRQSNLSYTVNRDSSITELNLSDEPQTLLGPDNNNNNKNNDGGGDGNSEHLIIDLGECESWKVKAQRILYTILIS